MFDLSDIHTSTIASTELFYSEGELVMVGTNTWVSQEDPYSFSGISGGIFGASVNDIEYEEMEIKFVKEELNIIIP